MTRTQTGCTLLTTVWLCATLSSAIASAQAPAAPVEARVPFAPTPVLGSDGLTHLGYELHITNFYGSTGNLQLERVEVLAANLAVPLVRHEGSDLARIVVQPGTVPPPTDPLAIPGGMRVVVYLWVTLPAGNPAPTSLRHRLFFRTDKETEEVDDARVDVRTVEPPVLGPPFRDGTWLVANGPGNHRSHHWAGLLATNGRVTIPQRFAMDLVGLDTDGRAVRGDLQTSANKDWVGYGAEVLAVADGVVREMQEGMPEKTPLAPNPPTAPTAQASGGNYVLLDLGHNIFVFYAHLQPNSVKVRTATEYIAVRFWVAWATPGLLLLTCTYTSLTPKSYRSRKDCRSSSSLSRHLER